MKKTGKNEAKRQHREAELNKKLSATYEQQRKARSAFLQARADYAVADLEVDKIIGLRGEFFDSYRLF